MVRTMITPLLFLTVSAFSTPLLENSAYIQNNSACTLRIKEERYQDKIVLALSSNHHSNFDIKIYHFNDLSAPSRGKLTQEPIFNKQKADINYLVDHNLFKRIDNDNVIYSTTIANDNVSPKLFIDTFRSHGNRSRIQIEGLEHTLSFVADHKQAQDFYKCTDSYTAKPDVLAKQTKAVTPF
ncbi:hypothetical protein I3271_16145 [Photobacterium leiognathi]|nr:hypothetical protein [Photobacterium leiognathi]PSW55161.1 hypothetical protein CTM83_02105 [Photobacterium leiognathi subsp. mandapamensis]PSW67449.1 hypothetical protein C0W88_04580 [Photobacterium leiognathi subsp. mandapamensis]